MAASVQPRNPGREARLPCRRPCTKCGKPNSTASPIINTNPRHTRCVPASHAPSTGPVHTPTGVEETENEDGDDYPGGNLLAAEGVGGCIHFETFLSDLVEPRLPRVCLRGETVVFLARLLAVGARRSELRCRSSRCFPGFKRRQGLFAPLQSGAGQSLSHAQRQHPVGQVRIRWLLRRVCLPRSA